MSPSQHPIASLIFSANSQIRALLMLRSLWCGSRSDVFLTIVVSSAFRTEASNPVSPAERYKWVATCLIVDVDRGTTSTVSALGCRLRSSTETITTGLAFLPGGSVGRLTNQISPRNGVLVAMAN
jgi:hypothetical protein